MKQSELFIESANGTELKRYGNLIIRYGLAAIFIWIGILKFTEYEAAGIQPLVENSPLLSWIYQLLSVRNFSDILGVIEILIGLLIAMSSVSPKLSTIGSIGAIILFITTLSFMLSTPGVIQPEYSFPFISPMPGQFLAKDILLLGASVWTAGDSLSMAQLKKRDN